MVALKLKVLLTGRRPLNTSLNYSVLIVLIAYQECRSLQVSPWPADLHGGMQFLPK